MQFMPHFIRDIDEICTYVYYNLIVSKLFVKQNIIKLIF